MTCNSITFVLGDSDIVIIIKSSTTYRFSLVDGKVRTGVVVRSGWGSRCRTQAGGISYVLG
jgi:hypothetical protein